MVFTGSTLGASSAFSSSDKPFLNDLMPLAKSPISSEILPRPPNSNRPTASTMIQCQILMEPIGYPPQRRAHGAARLEFAPTESVDLLAAGRQRHNDDGDVSSSVCPWSFWRFSVASNARPVR